MLVGLKLNLFCLQEKDVQKVNINNYRDRMLARADPVAGTLHTPPVWPMPSDGGGEGDNHTGNDDTSFDTTNRHCSNTTDSVDILKGETERVGVGRVCFGRVGRVPSGLGQHGLRPAQ